MRSPLRPAALLVLAALVAPCAIAATASSPAGAAVPREWLGVMGDGPLLDDPRVDLGAETRLMAADGVSTMRVALYWPDAEPAPGRLEWAGTDRAMAAAAAAGIRVLPTVLRSPAWAAAQPGREGSPPRDPADYARFLRAAVGRYGRGGTFWGEHPELAALAPRLWQVWNEPTLTRYWTARPWAPSYVRLLRAARTAIKGADPRAKVVAAGLTGRTWEDLPRMYRAGARGLFDLAAIHPFSRRPSNVLKIVALTRAAMRRHGDGRTPLLLTEVTWSSGAGQSTYNYGWETTEAGQARRLRQALPMLARARRSLGIAGLYWYTWLSPARGSALSFDYGGLRRLGPDGPVSKPALGALRRVARALLR